MERKPMNRIASATFASACLLLLAACGGPSDSTGSKAARPATPAPSAPPASAEAPPAAATADYGGAAPSATGDDFNAIQAAAASKDEAYKAGNANAIIPFYENDAVLMPPAQPTAKGRMAVRQSLAANLTEMAASGFATTISEGAEIVVSGDYAFRSGTYSTTDKTGATVDTGKWLEVWHKANGAWRITKSISNSDSLPLLPDVPEAENEGG